MTLPALRVAQPDVPVRGVERVSLRGAERLTDRQRQILAVMADGLTRSEAAYRLGLSVHTVEDQLGKAFIRFDVGSLVELYRVLGWLEVPG